jgi:hypothetical protein
MIMRSKIELYLFNQFIKTSHFSERQKQRGISDRVVTVSLSHLSPAPKKDLLVVVSSRMLREWAKHKLIHEKYRRTEEELFIKIDNSILVTCFVGEFGKYRGHRRPQHYWFIQRE